MAGRVISYNTLLVGESEPFWKPPVGQETSLLSGRGAQSVVRKVVLVLVEDGSEKREWSWRSS